MTHARLESPATARNREPIFDVLRDVLPEDGLVLEVGSGPGEHAAFFASRLPNLTWQPSDRGHTHDSIRAWAEHLDADNVREPATFDLFDERPPVEHADAVVCINTIHIAEWPATDRLFRHAASILPADAPLFLYGPFRYEDRPLEPSNRRFDESIQARIPGAGLRVFEEVDEIARDRGFRFCEDRPMPANNHCIWWRKR